LILITCYYQGVACGRVIRLYCAGLSHRAGIRYYR